MLEIILLVTVFFVILTFFYKQAICEFRINQLEWAQRDTLRELFSEKVPVVVRSIPSAMFWTRADVLQRPCFQSLPIFQGTTLTEWIAKAKPDAVCPWRYAQAETVALASGLPIWASKWLNPSVIHPALTWWMTTRYHCWAGAMGLRRTLATWTCLFPVEGELLVTIMTENIESSLPPQWVNCFPAQLTAKDTPFVADIKYMDIVLRPGTCLFLPAHWFVSWTGTRESTVLPMACTISYHTPISLMAFHASPFTK